MATKQALTVKQVIAGFSVGHMTVYNWRQGTKTKDPLPCHVEDGKVTLYASEVKAWAKKYDLSFDLDRALKPVAASKPGPKAKATKPVGKKAVAKKLKPVNKVARKVSKSTAKRMASVAKKVAAVAQAAAA